MTIKPDFPLKETAEPRGQRADGTKYRVLVVDDSLFIKKHLEQILTSEGFEVVDTATDGQEAVQKYQQLHPDVDLVTLDITMPKMDGIAALQQIMNFDSNAKVVMVSALGKQDLVKQALVLGAKGYVVKPLEREKVLERILAVID